MRVFFFVIGLELKREIITDELPNPKDAVLPLAAVGFTKSILIKELALLILIMCCKPSKAYC